MDRPPCWPESQPCPNNCAHQLYERTVHNLTPLHGPWAGWRMAGRVLVSPDGDRISAERLRGILWTEQLRGRYGTKRRGTCVGLDHRGRDPAGAAGATRLRGLADPPRR